MIYCSGIVATLSFHSNLLLELSIEILIFSSYTSCLNNLNNAVENQQDGPLNIGKA